MPPSLVGTPIHEWIHNSFKTYKRGMKSSYRKDSQTLYVGGEMDYLATKHVMKKRQTAKHRISRQSGLEMFGGPQFMMRV